MCKQLTTIVLQKSGGQYFTQSKQLNYNFLQINKNILKLIHLLIHVILIRNIKNNMQKKEEINSCI